MSRADDPMAVRARTSSSTVAPCFRTTLRVGASLAVTVVSGTTSVVPFERGTWLRNEQVGLDLDGEIAVQNRDGRDTHVLADDDGAGAFVDDDPGGHIDLDSQIFQRSDEFGHAGFPFGRSVHADQGGILGLGYGTGPQRRTPC